MNIAIGCASANNEGGNTLETTEQETIRPEIQKKKEEKTEQENHKARGSKDKTETMQKTRR
jgi:hypothetical protein